jgi:ssDNA-binding replication factor A large subunit
MKVKDIKPFQKKISLLCKVISKTEIRKVVSRLDEIEHKVCEALIGDDTGVVYLTLWDLSIEKLEEGKVYSFENLYSSEFKKSLRLNLGRFGEFKEVSQEIEVNNENNISQEV